MFETVRQCSSTEMEPNRKTPTSEKEILEILIQQVTLGASERVQERITKAFQLSLQTLGAIAVLARPRL